MLLTGLMKEFICEAALTIFSTNNILQSAQLFIQGLALGQVADVMVTSQLPLKLFDVAHLIKKFS
jgi:hypothetical protein